MDRTQKNENLGSLKDKLARAQSIVLADFRGVSVVSDTTLATGLTNALDVAVGSDGTIYVAEYGGNKVTFFKPDGTAWDQKWFPSLLIGMTPRDTDSLRRCAELLGGKVWRA